jgi:hypothetical protein
MLATIKDWEIPEKEYCSDHNIITFDLNFAYDKAQIYIFLGTRYILKGQHTEIYKNLLQQISKNFKIENNERNTK